MELRLWWTSDLPATAQERQESARSRAFSLHNSEPAMVTPNDDLIARVSSAQSRRFRFEKSHRPPDGLPRSVAHARTSDAGAGRAHLSFREGLIHPEPDQVSWFEPRIAVRSRARWTRSKQQPWKRKLRPEFRPLAPPMSRRDGRKGLADRLMPPQAAGMSCYSATEEITPERADFLVVEAVSPNRSQPVIAGKTG